MNKCKTGKYAVNLADEFIEIRYAQIGQQYFCNFCEQEVSVRKTQNGKKYYAHKRKGIKRSHDFSEHQQIQHQIAKQLHQMNIPYQLEHTFSEQIRTDLLFKKDNQYYVIEVQRSKISFAEIDRRIAFYERRGITLIWILIEKSQKLKGFSKWQQYLFAKKQHVLLYDVTEKHIKQMLSCYKISVNKCNHDSKKISLEAFISGCPQTLEKRKANYKFFMYHLRKWQEHYAKRFKRKDNLALLLYETRLSIDQINSRFYTPNIPMLNFKESCYWAQAVLYLLFIEKEWTIQEVVDFCQQKLLLFDARDVTDILSYLKWLEMKQVDAPQ